MAVPYTLVQIDGQAFIPFVVPIHMAFGAEGLNLSASLPVGYLYVVIAVIFHSNTHDFEALSQLCLSDGLGGASGGIVALPVP